MANTHLNILSFELSKTLREYGFNYWTQYFYNKEGNIESGEWAGYNESEETLAAPNAFIVRQWLRNEFDVDIFICRLSNITIPNLGYGFIVYTSDSTEPIIHNTPFETYEEAEIGGIDYVFTKLISNEQNGTESKQ